MTNDRVVYLVYHYDDLFGAFSSEELAVSFIAEYAIPGSGYNPKDFVWYSETVDEYFKPRH